MNILNSIKNFISSIAKTVKESVVDSYNWVVGLFTSKEETASEPKSQETGTSTEENDDDIKSEEPVTEEVKTEETVVSEEIIVDENKYTTEQLENMLDVAIDVCLEEVEWLITNGVSAGQLEKAMLSILDEPELADKAMAQYENIEGCPVRNLMHDILKSVPNGQRSFKGIRKTIKVAIKELNKS